jgi:ferredoxin-NADP reductase
MIWASPEDAPFLDELRGMPKRIEAFELRATMTQLDKSSRPWSGRAGAIDSDLLNAVVSGLPSPVCYIAGPPAMVEAMRRNLNQVGVDDDDIKSEDFFGY